MFLNANLKSSNLDEHFKNRYGDRDARNDIETLRVKRAGFDRAGTLPMDIRPFHHHRNHYSKLLIKLHTRLLSQRSPHTVGEKLIKPCVRKRADIVLGKEATKQQQRYRYPMILFTTEHE